MGFRREKLGTITSSYEKGGEQGLIRTGRVNLSYSDGTNPDLNSRITIGEADLNLIQWSTSYMGPLKMALKLQGSFPFRRLNPDVKKLLSGINSRSIRLRKLREENCTHVAVDVYGRRRRPKQTPTT